jgi:uncharacterized protein
MTEIAVRDNPQASRFEVYVDGEFAGVSDYRLTDDQIIFPHVEVDPRFRGHGVAAVLVRYALDAVRDEGTRTVVPVCPYVQTFIRRYPEYRSLVEGPVRTPEG